MIIKLSVGLLEDWPLLRNYSSNYKKPFACTVEHGEELCFLTYHICDTAHDFAGHDIPIYTLVCERKKKTTSVGCGQQ